MMSNLPCISVGHKIFRNAVRNIAVGVNTAGRMRLWIPYEVHIARVTNGLRGTVLEGTENTKAVDIQSIHKA